jgi:hypothetical protein
MTHDRTDDVLKDLEAALAVTPSPGFADGVRARIRGESARTRTWPAWTMAALAAAAAIVVAFVAWPRREAAPAAVAVTASRSPEPVVAASPSATPVVDAGPGITIAKPRVSHDVPRRAPAPEVLVPRDQALALEALVAGLSNATIDAESLATPPPDASTPLPATPQIVIAPIVIPPIDLRVPETSGGATFGGIR